METTTSIQFKVHFNFTINWMKKLTELQQKRL